LKFTAKSWVTVEFSPIVTEVGVSWAAFVRATFKVAVGSASSNGSSISTVAELVSAANWGWTGFKFTVGTDTSYKATIRAFLDIVGAHNRGVLCRELNSLRLISTAVDRGA